MEEVTERIVPRSPDPVTDPPAALMDDPRGRRPPPKPGLQVRAADLQPYIGLNYLSRLFKFIAIILVILLISEIITGLVGTGMEAMPTLLGEVSRLIVLAGLLWGCGDLAILLIDMGHDLRATRILLGRQLALSMNEQHSGIDPVMSQPVADSPATV